MIRRDDELPSVYLKPGQMYFAESPAMVITVLGSCVAITMFNRRLGLAAICHGMLPLCRTGTQCSTRCVESYRYVDCSIRQMAKLFDRHGVKRREVEVKFFGGSDMFSRGGAREQASVGKQNLTIAEQTLLVEGFSLKVSDVGGTRGRKIYFYTDTGDVFLKRLSKVDNPDIKW